MKNKRILLDFTRCGIAEEAAWWQTSMQTLRMGSLFSMQIDMRISHLATSLPSYEAVSQIMGTVHGMIRMSVI